MLLQLPPTTSLSIYSHQTLTYWPVGKLFPVHTSNLVKPDPPIIQGKLKVSHLKFTPPPLFFPTANCLKDYEPIVIIGPSETKQVLSFNYILEDTACYAGLLLAPAEGFGLWPWLFQPFGQKKSFLCCFGPFLAIFWCPVVAVVTFSSNLSNFERNQKKRKHPKKIPKNPKKSKNQKMPKNPKIQKNKNKLKK